MSGSPLSGHLFHQAQAAASSSSLAAGPRLVDAPESTNGSEDTRDKDGKLKRTREGCYTCRNRKKKCDQVRPICGSCSRLSFTCEFPPQVLNADGQLVTVRQPNKRKKDRAAGGAGGDGTGSDAGADPKKQRMKTHPGPRPGSKAAAQQLAANTVAATATAAAVAAAVDKGKGRADVSGSALLDGYGHPLMQMQQQQQQQHHAATSSYLDPAGQHHRSYSNSTMDHSVRSDFQQSHQAVDDPYPHVDGQSHFLQPRTLSSSSQGSGSSDIASIRPGYHPSQLQGSPNMPSSLRLPDMQATPAASSSAQVVGGVAGSSSGGRGVGGAAGIRDRFDHMIAQRSSPMQNPVSIPAVGFGPQQLQQQHTPAQSQQQQSLAGTPDLFNRPFSPFSTSIGAVGQGPEAQNRLLQEMHRQFQQSFPQQPTSAPSPSFSEWMKSFGDAMDSPRHIFGEGAAPAAAAATAVGAAADAAAGAAQTAGNKSHVDANGVRFTVAGAESPMSWLAPSPAPSSLHLGLSQTPVYQHAHPAIQSSPLHQTQTPLAPPPLPPGHLAQQFDARLAGGGTQYSASMPPPPTRTSPSRPSGPAATALRLNGPSTRPYVASSGGGSSHSHFSPPGGAAWQPESLEVPNTGYLPSAFIEPIPDEGDSDTRDFINGYSNGEPPVGEGAPGSPIVRAGPNRSVTVSSTLAPTITIKLPELPQMIADQAPLLIDYFVRKLSPLISVLSARKTAGTSPVVQASVGGSDIASVFVPMASQSELMLLSVLGWSSMHLHELGEPWREIADLLRTQLVERVENAFIAWEENKGPHIDDEEMLACLVALSEIEICRGSTSKWYRPLIMARQVIRRIGGAEKIKKLNLNTKWLLQNWAYHSLLSSTDCLDGPSLEPEEYAAILCGGLSSFMGPSMIVFQIIAETSRLSVEAAHCIHSDRDKRIEALRVLAAKDARLKARLDAVYPEFPPSEDLTTPETSYHLAAFRCFVLTARLYLRQVVSHCNAHSLVTQLLVNQLLANIGNVIGTPAESSLLFPLFITGVDATTESDRKIIKGHFLVIDNNCRIGNIQTAYSLLEEIWERNDSGERWVDWPKLSRELGWNVSFA